MVPKYKFWKQFFSLVIVMTIALSADAQGKVGINTTTPAAMLHVMDSSVVFTAPAPIATSGNPPVSGAGSRMMWYADKAAFRAGLVNGMSSTYWNKDSIGYASVGLGHGTKAKGVSSIATGYFTSASGSHSTAFGHECIASGYISTAMGYKTTASGWYSTAIGSETIASNNYATAMGKGTIASDNYTTAMGYNTKAQSDFSTSTGSGTIAKGTLSFTMGHHTIAESYASVVIGRYNDTTSISSSSWNSNDPLFVAGNGNSVFRSNAFTLLKNGKTGINVNYPTAMLHVGDSSVVFTGFDPLPTMSVNPPISGAGTRMMWYPDKAAFRAGNVSGFGANNWNKDNIGLYSVAFGLNPKASGLYSFASGLRSVASGESSTAMGSLSIASGISSTAIGEGTWASNTASTAFGYLTTAAGVSSIAMGNETSAFGITSTAMGNGTTASGSFSTAMGNNTIADGEISIALGSASHASGQRSTAMGFQTTASGIESTAMGNGTTASGSISTAMGFETTASGSNSVAMGHTTTANSYASVVLGRYNDLTSVSSSSWISSDPLFIIGNGTESSSSNAVTVLKNGNVGIGTDVSPGHKLHVTHNVGGEGGWSQGIMVESMNETAGEAAIAFRNTHLPNNRQWMVGINQGDPSLSFNYGSALLTTNTKMFIDTTGRVGIGTNTPDARIHIFKGTGGEIYNSSSSLILEDDTDHYIQFSNPNDKQCGIRSGNSDIDSRSSILFFADSSITFRAGGTSTRMTIENNGYVGIGTTSPDYLLEVNGTAGKPGGGSWTNTSDIRLKQNIHPYRDGLASILKINPVTYQYNELSGYDTDAEHVGVIAQELKEVAPYMVSDSNKKTEDGVNNYLKVDNSAMTYMLINAVKEQQDMIKYQKETIDFLIQELASIKQQLGGSGESGN